MWMMTHMCTLYDLKSRLFFSKIYFFTRWYSWSISKPNIRNTKFKWKEFYMWRVIIEMVLEKSSQMPRTVVTWRVTYALQSHNIWYIKEFWYSFQCTRTLSFIKVVVRKFLLSFSIFVSLILSLRLLFYSPCRHSIMFYILNF